MSTQVQNHGDRHQGHLPYLLIVVALSAFVSQPAWAHPWEIEQNQEPTGFIISPLLGAQASHVWSYDDMNVMVSPSRFEARHAGAWEAGSQFGFELGYGFDEQWRLVADFRLAYLEQDDVHDAGVSLIVERQVVDDLALRLGLGYHDYEAVATVTTVTTAGPDRQSEAEWQQSLKGTAFTGQLGIEYQLDLSEYFALTAALDATVGILDLEDSDELRFDDAMSAGIQLAIGTRLYL